MPVFTLVPGVFNAIICPMSGVFDVSICSGVWCGLCQYLLWCLVCLMPVFAPVSGVFDASICSGVWCV